MSNLDTQRQKESKPAISVLRSALESMKRYDILCDPKLQSKYITVWVKFWPVLSGAQNQSQLTVERNMIYHLNAEERERLALLLDFEPVLTQNIHLTIQEGRNWQTLCFELEIKWVSIQSFTTLNVTQEMYCSFRNGIKRTEEQKDCLIIGLVPQNVILTLSSLNKSITTLICALKNMKREDILNDPTLTGTTLELTISYWIVLIERRTFWRNLTPTFWVAQALKCNAKSWLRFALQSHQSTCQ